jgi:hypothetical protein
LFDPKKGCRSLRDATPPPSANHDISNILKDLLAVQVAALLQLLASLGRGVTAAPTLAAPSSPVPDHSSRARPVPTDAELDVMSSPPLGPTDIADFGVYALEKGVNLNLDQQKILQDHKLHPSLLGSNDLSPSYLKKLTFVQGNALQIKRKAVSWVRKHKLEHHGFSDSSCKQCKHAT